MFYCVIFCVMGYYSVTTIYLVHKLLYFLIDSINDNIFVSATLYGSNVLNAVWKHIQNICSIESNKNKK